MSEAWQIIFDGGSLGNPGKGYGSYRLRIKDQEWSPAVRLEFGSDVTNNEAEYRSLIAGLIDLAGSCGNPRAVNVEVLGDSQLVLNQLKRVWKVKAANLRPLYLEASAQAGQFGHVKYIWQRRDASVELLGH